jgi:hypothetical protein
MNGYPMFKEKRYKEMNVINEIIKNNPCTPEQIKVKSKRNKESNPNDIKKKQTLETRNIACRLYHNTGMKTPFETTNTLKHF